MKQGSVILVDRWREAGKKINSRSRELTVECRAAPDTRAVFLSLGSLLDTESREELDANKRLTGMGWAPPVDHDVKSEFNLTREQAIEVIVNITDRDDPYWENLVQGYYDEETDNLPSLEDVLRPLGISAAEVRKAEGGTI